MYHQKVKNKTVVYNIINNITNKYTKLFNMHILTWTVAVDRQTTIRQTSSVRSTLIRARMIHPS